MFHIHHLRKFTSLRGPQSTRQSSLSRRICTSDSKSTTTVYRGTLFEQRSLALLEQHLSMTLTRVGGKEDGGIDLIGWWWIPEDSEKSRAVDFSKRKRIRVVAQCKAEKKKIGPGYVRELEGVVYRNMDTFLLDKHRDLLGLSSIEGQKQQIPAAAVFLSESPYTKVSFAPSHVIASSVPAHPCTLRCPKAMWTPLKAQVRFR
ncbi:hypothetical protein VNI00_008700 [Paramarasmius palmivorus]|uniref:Restriction endonuclease type IV Mrr domain-containing protein n=1 Tax=Paramarasmius palmivorus TaxID=297713 RepID=A0AAW0CT81_9AGAR